MQRNGACYASGALNAIAAPPVVTADGTIYAASRGTLRSLTLQATLFRENWSGMPPAPTIGLDLDLPPAIDALGRVWTFSTDGRLNVTTAAGATSTVRTLGLGIGGPIILSDGSLVLGDSSNVLRRIAPGPGGADRWAHPPNLGAAPNTALAMAGGDAELLVPTFGGKLHALRAADGSEVWSAQLTGGPADLRAGNVYTPPGSTLSLGYFPSANGKLYAVVLDGRLDTAAPWPKAFHDTRNTGNAASPLP
jgi:outer membrane protein assembly factor BamB